MTSWPLVDFAACVDDVTGGNVKTLQSEYLEEGTYPIIDQGQKPVAGYTNDSDRLVRSGGPLIVFGDHTRFFKFLDEPFALGADGVKVLRSKAGFDAKFLYHFLSTRRLPGAGYSRHFKFLKQISVPKPPIGEQRRIAEVLDRADAWRAKRRDALALLDDLTQSIFLDMFGDPASDQQSWPQVPFGEACELQLGKMLDQKKQTGRDARPYLRNANVQWFDIAVHELFAMDFDARARERFRLRAGDVLVCEGGEPGRAAIWSGELEECYFQKALYRVRPHPGVALPEFVVWWFWFTASRGLFRGHVNSATIAHLTREKLAVLPFPMPPLELQAAFAERLACIEAARAQHQRQAQELDLLFSSLQQRAFAGEL